MMARSRQHGGGGGGGGRGVHDNGESKEGRERAMELIFVAQEREIKRGNEDRGRKFLPPLERMHARDCLTQYK